MSQGMVYMISLPEYSIDSAPDEIAIGAKLDVLLKQHFLGKSILIRGIASSEHPGKTIDEIVDIIQNTGTDRYDPTRKGDRYENIEGKHIDLFAFPAIITNEIEIMRWLIYGFYHSAIAVHGRPSLIDVIMIYDAMQMTRVLHQYKGRDDIKDDGFVFNKNRDRPSALLGVITVDNKYE
jgi:hypothetical protein